MTGNTPEIAAAVAANELDVALVTLPVAGRQLRVDAGAARSAGGGGPAVPRGRGAARSPPAELARYPLIVYERGGAIRRVIDGWFRRGGARPRIVMELGNEEAIKKLVGAGLGISVSPAMAVRDEVRWARSPCGRSRPPSRGAWARAPARQARDPALRVFLAALEGLPQGSGLAMVQPKASQNQMLSGKRARQPVAAAGRAARPHRGDVVLALETPSIRGRAR